MKNSKVALILGHPGHELRVHRFLEIYKPRVYVLTDGSGSAGESRVYNTLKIIKDAGASASPLMGRFSDSEIYSIILQQNSDVLIKLMEEIVEDMEKNEIEFIAGDAIEGYNPTHDLCRYMINSVVRIYSDRQKKEIPNFEFLLNGPPHQCPENLKDEAIWITLTDEDLERKLQSAYNYEELKKDVESLYKAYGKLPFQTECLWPVKDPELYRTWQSEMPFYESHGAEKVASGTYEWSISYNSHLLPLGQLLSHYSKSKLL